MSVANHKKKKDEIIRKQFKEIIDCINDGIFITDGEGNILILNKASAELCRYDEDYLTGKNMEMLVDTACSKIQQLWRQ